MLRSNSRNKENTNNKERRTSSLQRRRSILSILSSPSSIQKPERGRSQNRRVMRDLVGTNKAITDRRNDNGNMDVEIQGNILSSELQQRQQRSSAGQFNLSPLNNNEGEPDRNNDESLGEDRNLSRTSDDNIWNYFVNVGDNTYQCRLCLNVCFLFS